MGCEPLTMKADEGKPNVFAWTADFNDDSIETLAT